MLLKQTSWLLPSLSFSWTGGFSFFLDKVADILTVIIVVTVIINKKPTAISAPKPYSKEKE